MIYILMYLAAIVLANLSSATFGPSASVVNAFLFIGLDLTARDKLHDAWSGRGLLWKMGLLIVTGSLLSWVINRDAAQIAIASCAAFAMAASMDTYIYWLMSNSDYMERVNTSNFIAAIVDSVMFPTIAFGDLLPLITLGQLVAKVLGGYVWSLMLRRQP